MATTELFCADPKADSRFLKAKQKNISRRCADLKIALAAAVTVKAPTMIARQWWCDQIMLSFRWKCGHDPNFPTYKGGKMKSIKFAYIQSGYAVFGVGYTKKQAISDARKWLVGGISYSEAEKLATARPNNGEFTIIGSDHPEFDSYMGSQGGFERRGNGWYANVERLADRLGVGK